jgi:predicted nucleotidyltransferase
VDKGSYGWFSLRQDWWKDGKTIYIGDTDWGGLSIRSDENAAAQLMEALRSVYGEAIAPIRQAQEYDALLGEDYVNQAWYTRWYRFSTAVALNSWVGSGIKHVENACTGRTILDDEISGWDRTKLGIFGSIETLLTAVPAGKAVTAAGGRLGVGALAGSQVSRMMSYDILRGFGEAAAQRLASSAAGQAFLRAYAKVYNSKYNMAILGEKVPISLMAENVAGITAEQAAVLRQKLLEIPGVKDVRVFGSRTKGTSTAASDLDVVLIGDIDTSSRAALEAMRAARAYAKQIGIGPGKGGQYIDPTIYPSMSEACKPANWRPVSNPADRVPKFKKVR